MPRTLSCDFLSEVEFQFCTTVVFEISFEDRPIVNDLTKQLMALLIQLQICDSSDRFCNQLSLSKELVLFRTLDWARLFLCIYLDRHQFHSLPHQHQILNKPSRCAVVPDHYTIWSGISYQFHMLVNTHSTLTTNPSYHPLK